MLRRAVAHPIVDRTAGYLTRATAGLAKRSGNLQTDTGSYVVYGVQRAAFRAQIETTNVFLTSFVFFTIFILFTVIAVLLIRGFLILAVRLGWIKDENEQVRDFRNGWATVLKGILYRVCLIGYPAVAVFGFWELTQGDSPA